MSQQAPIQPAAAAPAARSKEANTNPFQQAYTDPNTWISEKNALGRRAQDVKDVALWLLPKGDHATVDKSKGEKHEVQCLCCDITFKCN